MLNRQLSCNRATNTIIIMFVLTVNSLYARGAPRFTENFERGMTALSKNNPDSAILFFVTSYSEGLSRDSLFYFWAEALLHKGVLDSALAANYIASCTHSDDLQLKVKVQRWTIYRLLGWTKEAELLLDTIHDSSAFRRAGFMPDIDMGITAGFGMERRGIDTTAPWGISNGSSGFRKLHGPSGKADIRTSWKLIQGAYTVSAGVKGLMSYRQFDEPAGLSDAADSIDITGALFTSATHRSITSTFTLSFNRRIDDSLFIGTGIEGGYAGGNHLLPMIWAGGTASLSPNGRISTTRAWLFALMQQTPVQRLQTTYTMYLSTFFARPSSFGFILDTVKILYAEDATRQYPVFYTDDAYSRVIDTSMVRVITGGVRNDIIASGDDSILYVGLKQPFSSVMINPRFSLTLQNRFPVQIGVAWRWNYFWEPHEWDQIKVYAHYLLHSRSDDTYYSIPEDLLTNDLTITRGSNGGLALVPAAQAGPSVIHHSLRRIDNTLSGDISLQLYDGRFGTGLLSVFGSKNWSTLSGRSPVEIPEWSVSTSLEWRIKIANKLVLH